MVLSFIGCIWKSSLAKVLRSQKLTGSNDSPKENLLTKCYLPNLGDEGWVRETDCLQKNHQKSCQMQDESPKPRRQREIEDGSIACQGEPMDEGGCQKGVSPAPDSLCSAATACQGLLRSEEALTKAALVLLVRINPSCFAPCGAKESVCVCILKLKKK